MTAFNFRGRPDLETQSTSVIAKSPVLTLPTVARVIRPVKIFYVDLGILLEHCLEYLSADQGVMKPDHRGRLGMIIFPNHCLLSIAELGLNKPYRLGWPSSPGIKPLKDIKLVTVLEITQLLKIPRTARPVGVDCKECIEIGLQEYPDGVVKSLMSDPVFYDDKPVGRRLERLGYDRRDLVVKYGRALTYRLDLL